MYLLEITWQRTAQMSSQAGPSQFCFTALIQMLLPSLFALP